jgi:hypothetical protein
MTSVTAAVVETSRLNARALAEGIDERLAAEEFDLALERAGL